MKTYFEVLAGTNPGGAIAMGANDITKGKIVAGVIGVLMVIPAEKLLALLERLPKSGLVLRFANGEEATISKKLMKEMRSLSEEEQLLFRQQLGQADTAAKARATIAEFAEKSVAAAKKGDIHHLATAKNWVSTLRGGPWSPRFEKIFKKAGMTLEDAANKVRIPGHAGPHPEEYHQAIFDRLTQAVKGLSGAKYTKKLLEELEKLATEASTVGTKLNDLLTKK